MMDKKQLWIESNRSDGTAFIAQDKPISDEDNEPNTFIVLDVNRRNLFEIQCSVCGIEIVHGWEAFSGADSYCDDHVEIMNV